MTVISKKQLEFGNPSPVLTVHLFKNISYNYHTEFIIAGLDKDKGGQVYSVSEFRLMYVLGTLNQKMG